MNSPSEEPPIEIDVRAVQSMIDSGEEFLFLDCREPEEVAIASIAGTTLIPMNELPTRLCELEPARDGRIVVHCHHGGRSLQVTDWLRRQGFASAQNMTGGIDLWSIAIDPAVPRY